jgi:RWD domain
VRVDTSSISGATQNEVEIEAEVEAPLNCTSDANVSEQQYEMEAISAIYPEEDIVVKRPAPFDTTMPSASFSILLTAPSADLTGVPPSWTGQISLALDFPPGYPLDEGSGPRVSVEVGSLSMMQFPSAFKKSLYLAVVSASTRCDAMNACMSVLLLTSQHALRGQ